MDDGAVQLEVMATSVDGVALAVGAGADRVELCQDMPAGGTTPSIGLVREALRRTSAAGVDLMVMIRPRGGHFVYSSEELDVMRADIEQVVALGVTGVVFGLLTPRVRSTATPPPGWSMPPGSEPPSIVPSMSAPT